MKNLQQFRSITNTHYFLRQSQISDYRYKNRPNSQGLLRTIMDRLITVLILVILMICREN